MLDMEGEVVQSLEVDVDGLRDSDSCKGEKYLRKICLRKKTKKI